jgi:hypothetical protein
MVMMNRAGTTAPDSISFTISGSDSPNKVAKSVSDNFNFSRMLRMSWAFIRRGYRPRARRSNYYREMFIISVVFIQLLSTEAQAFLDTLAQSAKETAKAAAYTEAVSELANELDDKSPVAAAALDLARRTEKLKTDVTSVYYASEEFKSLLQGPDWSSEHLDENIRYTTRYIRRAKRLFVQLGLLGTDVATAMNTAETNSALNEMLKNQQTQILLQKEHEVDSAEKEVSKEKQWNSFIDQERKNRGRL